MGYMKTTATLYAEAWLEFYALEWTEENWEKAMEWVCSHSLKECRDYIQENI